MRSSLSLQSEQSTLSQTEACCNRLRAQAPQGSATLCHPLPLRFCNRHFLSSRHSSSRSLARSALLARRPAITMSASDPFYLVKEEIQDSVTKLHTTLARWEKLPVSSTERSMLSREIVSTCESISWQVDELDKATGVAERDPARFSVDPAEIDRRKKWTSSTRNQVHSITEKVQSTPTRNVGTGAGLTNRRELMRLDDSFQQTPVRTDHDSYISNESDRQELLLREQDDDLDELSVSLGHVGHVGLVIHEELSLQGGFMDKLSDGMDGTATRLDLVQKKLTTVMKKAGWKGQVLMIVFLVVLLLILTFLVFSA